MALLVPRLGELHSADLAYVGLASHVGANVVIDVAKLFKRCLANSAHEALVHPARDSV